MEYTKFSPGFGCVLEQSRIRFTGEAEEVRAAVRIPLDPDAARS